MPITSITLDTEIYPQNTIDHKRVNVFAENIRDGFDPIHVQALPEDNNKYRILSISIYNVHK